MSLLNEDHTKFIEQGYLQMPSFVEPRDCERLILRMRELTERKCQNNDKHLFRAGLGQTGDDFFLASAHRISFFFDKNGAHHEKKGAFFALNKVGHALHRLCPVFDKFSHQEKIYRLMSDLGQEKPLLLQSMFIFKQSRFGDEVPPHQDATFLYTEPNSVVGLWFALQDADEENGCLWVLPGGHKSKLKNRFIKTQNGLSFAHHEKVHWPKEKFRPLLARTGDAIVLHGHLPHFSEQNQSSRTRFAYTLHFINKNCYYPKSNWLDITLNN